MLCRVIKERHVCAVPFLDDIFQGLVRYAAVLQKIVSSANICGMMFIVMVFQVLDGKIRLERVIG